MIISLIIILSCFIGVVVCILTNKLNRAVAALLGAVIVYFVLIFIEGNSFSLIVDLIFGTQEEGFVNTHSLIIIIAMLIIVEIGNEAGLFQFMAIKLIQYSNGRPILLLGIICTFTVFISAVLNNILTVIILIPLTITVSRILAIDPTPYILTQAILVNIGGTMFSISSIPNILITTYANISLFEFFLNVGIISLMTYGVTLLFFIFLYKKDLTIPKEGVRILNEFNAWNFVPNRTLLIKSAVALVTLLSLLMIIPSEIIPADMLALTIAVLLLLISKVEPKNIIGKLNYELIFYLIGIFVIVGALEVIGFSQAIGAALSGVGGDDLYFQLLFVLWISALLSSNIDNIPITKLLIPIIDDMAGSSSIVIKNQFFYALAIGANWGDNLTPLGDNVLVVSLSEQHQRPVTFRQFFKIGFVTTLYQLCFVSLIFTLIFRFLLGIFIVIIIIFSLVTLYLIYKFGSAKIKSAFENSIKKIRSKITK